MNRNSNVYTIVYAAVLTVVVAVLLAVASLGLHDRQQKNLDDEKKMMILSAIKPQLEAAGFPAPTLQNAGDIWGKLEMDIHHTSAITTGGACLLTDPLQINIKQQFVRGVVKPDAELPEYQPVVDGKQYYIYALYGAGLWDAIWGYIAVEDDGVTIAGVTFDHAGETAGLGAKIKDDPAFAASFVGKRLFTEDGDFTSVAVLKAGKKADKGDQVDAITGATMTSNGVSEMIRNSMAGYEAELRIIQDIYAQEHAATETTEVKTEENLNE